jgi:hypothetical protein
VPPARGSRVASAQLVDALTSGQTEPLSDLLSADGLVHVHLPAHIATVRSDRRPSVDRLRGGIEIDENNTRGSDTGCRSRGGVRAARRLRELVREELMVEGARRGAGARDRLRSKST